MFLWSPGTARNSLNQPNVWLTVFLTSLLCILPVVAFRFMLIQLRPTINEKVRRKCSYMQNYLQLKHFNINYKKDLSFSLFSSQV